MTAGLQKLMERDPALVALLPRQPGARESRYAHLLCGPVESAIAATADPEAEAPSYSTSQYEDRIAQLESTVAELQREIAALREKIDTLFG